MVRAVTGVGAALALTISLAACGGDDEKDAAAQTGSNAQPAADEVPIPTFPTPSAAPIGLKALDGVPEVTKNGQNFDKEPVLAKGTGDAPTGLVIRDLMIGNGEAARPTDTVKVRYVGALYSDGSVFDASWQSGPEPIEFPLNRVVPGFAGGIVGMKLGGRREIVIPASMGYGDRSQPGIPAGSTLVFIVDLMEVSRPDTGEVDPNIPGG